MARLPARFELPLFAFLLSGLMSCLVSGVATFNAVGLADAFLAKWGTAWLSSWLVAFPAVIVVAPLVRRLVARLIESPN